MNFIAILATRLSSFLLHLIHRGGSLPGQIGLTICPQVLKRLTVKCPIIVVTGTNGKTSTSNMISSMFEHAGYHVISNRKGDNLKEGIATVLLSHSSFMGKVKADAIVLEVDELNIPFTLNQLPVTALVVTNFFRDQLDRAREMEQLIHKIEQAVPVLAGTMILNGNDPNVIRLKDHAPKADALYFGIDRCATSVETTVEASEGKFCPRCGSKVAYDYYQYSHIGVFHCVSCDFQSPALDAMGEVIDIPSRTFAYEGTTFHAPQGGLYTMYNCMAVLCVAKRFQIDVKYAEQAFSNIKVPNGRNEEFTFHDQTCVLNLIKNPTGANEVMKVIEEDHNDKTILLVLNDKDQDGTDISWIYDTLFEKLMTAETKQIIVSGARCYDMALRLKYGGYQEHIDIKETLQDGVEALLQAQHTMYAIATYTALQPVRNLLLTKGKG